MDGIRDEVVNIRHAEQLRDALEQHHVRVETHFYAGRHHADTIASFTLVARGRTPALAQTITFLQSVTAQTGQWR